METMRGMLYGLLMAATMWFLLLAWAYGAPVSGLPVTLGSGSPSATVTVQAESPAGSGVLVLQVYDADIPDEGTLTVNGQSIPLFSGDATLTFPDTDASGIVHSLARNNVTVPVTLTIPIVDGVNTLAFLWNKTGGYRIESGELTYSTTVPDPPAPAEPIGDVATLRANAWLPPWGQPRFPDRVKRRTSTTPDRIYWGWKNPETLAIHTNWTPWATITPLTVWTYARKGLTIPADIPLTLCDRAFLWNDNAAAVLKACAEVYASSTATTGSFYATASTSAAKVGSAAKGASCNPWLYSAPVSGSTSLHWFQGTAPDTQAVGFVRCKDMSK